jgi:hypothetical protein
MKTQLILFAITGFIFLGSCSKKDTNDQPIGPTNIVINAAISNDGSGNVSFTTTADHATTFKYEFGDGTSEVVPGGAVTHKYTTPGTMLYSVKVTATSSVGESSFNSKIISVTVTPTYTNFIWSDEFNNTGTPDPTKWGYDIGTGSGGWGNQELQYYTKRSGKAIQEVHIHRRGYFPKEDSTSGMAV